MDDDFDSLVPDAPTSMAPQQESMDFDSLQEDGAAPEPSLGQHLRAGAEGALEGAIGPLAPMVEKLAGVTYKSQREAAEASPVAHGVGQAVGLGAGMFTGSGEGGLMLKAGKGATALTGLAHVDEAANLARMAKAALKTGAPEAEMLAVKAAEAAKGVKFGHKVGSEVVKNAAEMAVVQGSDETAKMITSDHPTSAQTAISNVGLAAALGGGIGGVGAGVVSPLWKTTAGPKVEALLNFSKDHFNQVRGAPLADDVAAGLQTLGVTPEAATRAGLSTNPTARGIHGTLQRAEKAEVVNGIEKLHHDVSESVANSLGTSVDEVLRYDKSVVGRELEEIASKEFQTINGPIQQEWANARKITGPKSVLEDDLLQHTGVMFEEGAKVVSPQSPYYKLYETYGDRLLKTKTIDDIEQLGSEVTKRAYGAMDGNEKDVLRHIRSSLDDLADSQAALHTTDVLGVGDRRAAYKEFAKMSNELTANLGIGRFKGAETLKNKLANEITPELLLKKFSVKNNAEFMPFLKQYLPETYQAVLKNERLELIKPAILNAAKKGENPINIKMLGETIDKAMAGNKSYIEAILPKEALDKVYAARNVINALPQVKDSGTPAGLAKLFARMPSSVMAAIAMLTGHNPFIGGILGEAAQRLGKDAPEAIKLSYLKYLGSDQPIKAEGFKAMVDYMHAAYKGEKAINKSIQGVFKPGIAVLADSQMPTAKQLAKLDKMVVDSHEKPDKVMEAQASSQVGHYMPEAQQAITQASLSALQYLQGIKPKPYQPSPLDRPIEPTPAEEARYDRALSIAQSPAIVLEHIKNGTIQTTDIQDINGMYPDLHNRMCQQITSVMASRQADEEPIPYKTRMGISLFMGQALDSSMQPANIVAAQPLPTQPISNEQPPQGKGSPSKLKDKTAKTYQTPDQAAQQDRAAGRSD